MSSQAQLDFFEVKSSKRESHCKNHNKKIPPFPYTKPTLAQADQSFLQLKNEQLNLVDKKWNAKGGITGSLLIPKSKNGMKASDYFHWQARMSCDSLNSPSPIRSWYDKKIRKSVESSIYYKENPATALALRKYIATQFRPSSAKILIEHFDVKKWYDPCGGWGDRMLSAQATGVEYFCRDVNPLVFSGYALQQQHFGGNVSFELKGSEIDCPEKEYFDFVFTSPPYYKIEKYLGEKQSHKLFKKFGEWVIGFLIPMLSNSWDSLKPKGVFAINVANVYANHEVNNICDPVLNFIKKRSNDVRFIGYPMNLRPNTKISKKLPYCEPIIVGVKP